MPKKRALDHFIDFPIAFLLGVLVGCPLSYHYLKSRMGNTKIVVHKGHFHHNVQPRNRHVSEPDRSRSSVMPELENRLRRITGQPDKSGDPGMHSFLPAMGERQKDFDYVANLVAKEVKLFCWVNTKPGYHESRAKHAKATWMKKCDKILFFSHVNNTELPSIGFYDVPEGKKLLWKKSRRAYQYIYENYAKDYHWFLKADDDSYVVVENLKFMLITYQHSEPLAFGCHYKLESQQGYMTGGPGHVMSRESLKRLVEGMQDTKCSNFMDDSSVEDVQLGKCLEAVGVKLSDSRDKASRSRFLPFVPDIHIFSGQDPRDVFHNLTLYPMDKGYNCCSEHVISFHHVSAPTMYFIDYMLYQFRLYGTATEYILTEPGKIEKTSDIDEDRLYKMALEESKKDRAPDSHLKHSSKKDSDATPKDLIL